MRDEALAAEGSRKRPRRPATTPLSRPGRGAVLERFPGLGVDKNPFGVLPYGAKNLYLAKNIKLYKIN